MFWPVSEWSTEIELETLGPDLKSQKNDDGRRKQCFCKDDVRNFDKNLQNLHRDQKIFILFVNKNKDKEPQFATKMVLV